MMRIDKPTVSAIVSTYNSECFFKGKIEDLLNQTIINELEIIIVNSGSTQNERQIYQKYFLNYSNIIYIETEKRETIYKAWNRGIKAANGKFITNANTDDRLKSNALKILSAYLQRNDDVALVYGNQYFSHKINQTFEEALKSKIIRMPDFDKILQLDIALIGSQPMWRASLHFAENIWFDENYEVSGDHDFELKVALNHKIKKLPDVLGTFYKSKKTNKSYENEERTNAEVKKVRYINTKRYVDSFSLKESEELLKKTFFFTKIPIFVFLVISKLNSKFRTKNPMFTLEFVYLFTALILNKIGDIKNSKRICIKYLKTHPLGNIEKVYKSILRMKKKFLILDHDKRFTGSTKSLLYFLDVLSKKNYEILLLTHKNKDYYKIFEKYDIKISEFCNWYNLNISSLNKIEFTSLRGVYSILLSFLRFIKGIVRSFKELKKNRPDLLFINEVVLMQFAVASFVLRIPTIIYVRTNFTKGRFGITGSIIRKLLLIVSTYIITISKNEYQQFNPQKNKIALKKVVLVREFLNNSDFRIVKNLNAIKEKYQLPINVPIVLMLGGLQQHKGSIDLLKALKFVIKKQKKMYVVIVGNISEKKNSYANKCFSFVENNDLKEYLKLIDEVEDVDDFISICDILISANTVSHFSRPVIEAWAKGKAVISSDFPHSREIIRNYENGILYQSGNTEQLAESIIKLISDEHLYNNIASNGYKTATNYFDAQKNSEIIIKLVNKLIT